MNVVFPKFFGSLRNREVRKQIKKCKFDAFCYHFKDRAKKSDYIFVNN